MFRCGLKCIQRRGDDWRWFLLFLNRNQTCPLQKSDNCGRRIVINQANQKQTRVKTASRPTEPAFVFPRPSDEI